MESAGPSAYQFEMLGAFRVHSGDLLLERFQTQKTASLLAFLAYHNSQRHTRDALVNLLWPDAAPEVGRNRLSQALTWLRRQLEALDSPQLPVLDADRLTVQLRVPQSQLDAYRFDTAARAASVIDTAALRAAVDLYGGPLLPDFYDDWILRERERLGRLYVRSVHHLVVALESQGDAETAIEYARGALVHDGLNEDAGYDLIRLLAENGQTTEALQQYQDMERRLAQDLDAPPAARLQALAESLRIDTNTGTEAKTAGPLTAARDSERPRLSTFVSIPAPLTRFFGREVEIADIHARIASRRERLLTLTGAGGAGKTRLASEVSRRIAAEGACSVSYTSLAELTTGRQIAAAIAKDLRLPQSRDVLPIDQIVERLSQGANLLTLDNLEHLADDSETAAVLRQLLERTPSLTILVTSRQRIGVEGECEVSVVPLPSPQAGNAGSPDVDELLACASVGLFVDRARAVRPDFTVTPDNGAAIGRLCERLEGIPLAIELCAAWAQTLTPAQMLDKLGHRFDLLVSRRKDISPRHRTLRSAIEYGFLQLPEDLKRVFVRLAVFRGGWNLAAAEAYLNLAGDASRTLSTLDALTELRERSLIFVVATVDAEGSSGMRYRMLESLREFAVEVFTYAEESTWRERHAEYFLGLVEAAEGKWSGREQGRWLTTLEAEHDNIRAAMDWALQAKRTALALRIAGALGPFWQTRGYLREGRDWLARALDHVDSGDPGAEAVSARIVAKAQTAFGHLAWSRGDYVEAQAAHESALTLRRALAEPAAISESLYHLGITAFRQDRQAAARARFDESLALAESAGDRAGISRIMLLYGNMALADNDLDAARDYYEQSLTIERSLGNRRRSADALNNLGLVARMQHDYPRATDSFRDVLAIRRELTDDFGAVIAYVNLGATLRRQGDTVAAQEMLAEGVRQAGESGQKYILVHGLIELSIIGIGAGGEYESGVTTISAAVQLYESLGSVFTDEERAEYQRSLNAARAAMEAEAYDDAWKRGSQMALPEAIALALRFSENQLMQTEFSVSPR